MSGRPGLPVHRRHTPARGIVVTGCHDRGISPQAGRSPYQSIIGRLRHARRTSRRASLPPSVSILRTAPTRGRRS